MRIFGSSLQWNFNPNLPQSLQVPHIRLASMTLLQVWVASRDVKPLNIALYIPMQYPNHA
jgi:hypothetical protein